MTPHFKYYFEDQNIGDEDDLLRYERSSSTDVVPCRLAANYERFHNLRWQWMLVFDKGNDFDAVPSWLLSSILILRSDKL